MDARAAHTGVRPSRAGPVIRSGTVESTKGTSDMTIATSVAPAPTSVQKLIIDFLYLDLTTCTRCRGTDRSLDAGLAAASDILTAAGVEVEVRKIHIQSSAQARAWRFVSSPTIRINGSDIAWELRESSCGSEACVDGCGDHVACRVWVFGNREYTEPPVELVVDAVLRHVYGPAIEHVEDRPYQLPENLHRFFAGRLTASTEGQPSCCAPAEQDACCEAEDKAGCCAEAVGCGCR
jgi:hypothetical protein